MWRVLIFLAAAFILYKLFTGEQFKKKTETAKVEKKKFQAGEMAKDPVCGAFVPVDGDIRVKDGGQVRHFCSYECRDKYLKQLEAGRKDEG